MWNARQNETKYRVTFALLSSEDLVVDDVGVIENDMDNSIDFLFLGGHHGWLLEPEMPFKKHWAFDFNRIRKVISIACHDYELGQRGLQWNNSG